MDNLNTILEIYRSIYKQYVRSTKLSFQDDILKFLFSSNNRGHLTFSTKKNLLITQYNKKDLNQEYKAFKQTVLDSFNIINKKLAPANKEILPYFQEIIEILRQEKEEEEKKKDDQMKKFIEQNEIRRNQVIQITKKRREKQKQEKETADQIAELERAKAEKKIIAAAEEERIKQEIINLKQKPQSNYSIPSHITNAHEIISKLKQNGIKVKKISSKGKIKDRILYYNKKNNSLTMKKAYSLFSKKSKKVIVNKEVLNNSTITLINNNKKRHKIKRAYGDNKQFKFKRGAEFHIPNKSPQ